jgi:Tfp pilus assembly protein PilF
MATIKILAASLLATLTVGASAVAADRSYLDQGIQLYNQRDYQRAAQSLSLAIQADRENASAFYYLANCAYAEGKRDIAIKYYWYVAHHFSSSKEAYYCRNVLRKIDPEYSKNSAISYASHTPN